MSVVQVSSRHLVTIPKRIRERLRIQPGQRFDIGEADGIIVLTPIPPDPVEFLSGIFEGQPSMTEELLAERRRDLRHE